MQLVNSVILWSLGVGDLAEQARMGDTQVGDKPEARVPRVRLEIIWGIIQVLSATRLLCANARKPGMLKGRRKR